MMPRLRMAQADSETTVWLDPRMAKFQQEVDKLMPGLVGTNGVSSWRHAAMS
jgi:hypothetical protein